jgi:DNA modification methylase
MIYQIGKHRVKHGNIMDGIDDLMQGEVADFVFSDPPWGQGNLRYWQTMNKKMTGAERIEIDYSQFMERYFQIVAKHVKDVIVIAYGQRWHQDVIDYAAKAGFKWGGSAKSFYSAELLPLDVHLFSKSGTQHVNQAFIDACALKEAVVVRELFKVCCPKDAKIILDPMCGLGITSRSAVAIGAAFRGNELNAARLAKTINFLEANK